VGVAFWIIDSSIWVAVITNFERRRARRMIAFWIKGTFSSATSTPSRLGPPSRFRRIEDSFDVLPGLGLFDLSR